MRTNVVSGPPTRAQFWGGVGQALSVGTLAFVGLWVTGKVLCFVMETINRFWG